MWNTLIELYKTGSNALNRVFIEDPLIVSLIIMIFVSILFILFVSKLPVNNEIKNLFIKFLTCIIIMLFMLILFKLTLTLLGNFSSLDKGIDRIHMKETNLLVDNQESYRKETRGNKMTWFLVRVALVLFIILLERG